MTAIIDTDCTGQMAFVRALVERAISQVESLLRQTDAPDPHSVAPMLALHMIAEILHDRHGTAGPNMFLAAANFAAGTIAAGGRLTKPETAS